MSSHSFDASNSKGGIGAYYKKLEDSDLNNPDMHYSMRYFVNNEFFHRKFDEMTPEKSRIRKLCPKARLTAFCKGSVYFPYKYRKEVLKHIAYDIETKSPMYWNQIAYDVEGEGFRLVVDIDSDTRILSSAEINKISIVLWNTLKDYYTDFESKPIEVFGSKCGPRMKKNKISTGLHFVCHVKVSIEEAQQLIFGFRLRLLKNSYINMKGLEVDAGIYRSNAKMASLRFIYSNKLEDCVNCQNITEKRMACTMCDRRGIIVSKMTYEPVLCVDHKGKVSSEHFKALHTDFFTIVQNHSIWPEPSDVRSDYKRPMIDPPYTVEQENEEPTQKGKKRKATDSNKRSKYKQVKVSDPSYDLLEEQLRAIKWKGESWWDGICVDKINVSAGKRSAQVFVNGLGCSMCLYAMKDHGTNRIWFSLNRKGVLTLQCNSKKVEYGCKKKDRIKFNIPTSISNRIFGIENPPGFGDGTKKYKDTDEFNMHQFIQRKPEHGKLSIKSVEEEDFQKQLKHLSDVYKLNL